MIRHIWFDFSDTLALINKKNRDQLVHQTYADVIKKPLDESVIQEYEDLAKKFPKSSSALFHSLGMPADFWSQTINSVDPSKIYFLADENIPRVLQDIKQKVPISLFSNLKLGKILPALGINPSWFTNTIDSSMIEHPKPALDGFYKMIELSGVPANEILYIGDHVVKDITPAKEVGMLAGIIWSKSDEADYSFENFEDILKKIGNKL